MLEQINVMTKGIPETIQGPSKATSNIHLMKPKNVYQVYNGCLSFVKTLQTLDL